ncbi:sulfurtransferase TusA family protein [Senegalia massiliensis]|jgi:TusA-related sulfurtransferase|uniref:sulfurtransferase TusA family protein n=1 Tax=Senegalia massiliensis TaxID=1720316 RepID=UPI00103154F8|nr:sulfurtransferase TusA family protein [Senegalia massiliensis]
MKVDKVLDVKGLSCPMPIVKTKKAIDELSVDQLLEVHVTDKGAKNDFAAWMKSSAHELLDTQEEENVIKFYIRKGN